MNTLCLAVVFAAAAIGVRQLRLMFVRGNPTEINPTEIYWLKTDTFNAELKAYEKWQRSREKSYEDWQKARAISNPTKPMTVNPLLANPKSWLDKPFETGACYKVCMYGCMEMNAIMIQYDRYGPLHENLYKKLIDEDNNLKAESDVANQCKKRFVFKADVCEQASWIYSTGFTMYGPGLSGYLNADMVPYATGEKVPSPTFRVEEEKDYVNSPDYVKSLTVSCENCCSAVCA